MAKKKLGNVNINTSNMIANISLERFDDQIQHAQFWLDSQIMTDMVPYMPHETGTFINVTRAKVLHLQVQEWCVQVLDRWDVSCTMVKAWLTN